MKPVAPAYLTAFEHEPVPIGEGGLTADEADHLARLGEQRRGFCERGFRSVRLAQYCGLVSMGGRMLEVLPKVADASSPEACRGILLRLLRQSRRHPAFQYLTASHHLTRAPLLEAFIAAFFDSVTEIARGGLLRQYRENDEDLPLVRGRIRLGRQLAALANRVDRVACVYDDLTADNQWNRLLKLGLRTVRPWIVTGELHRRWAELTALFEEVADTSTDAHRLDRLVFDRHAARYRAAVDWVRWILSLVSPSMRAGVHGAPGLLFDMNVLFEAAVASVLQRRAAGTGVQVEIQDSDRHLARIRGGEGRLALRLRPDLTFRGAEGGVAAVGDTKWKRLAATSSGYLEPAEADVYQMHAYSAAYGCRDVALIYPWHAGLNASRETVLELQTAAGARPAVTVVCVDVSRDDLPVRLGGSSSLVGRVLGGDPPADPRG